MSRRHLTYRTLQLTQGDTVRWLSDDIGRFLKTLERETAEMRANAELSQIPNVGSRLMVELAIYTVAADAALRAQGVGRHLHILLWLTSGGICIAACWFCHRCHHE